MKIDKFLVGICVFGFLYTMFPAVRGVVTYIFAAIYLFFFVLAMIKGFGKKSAEKDKEEAEAFLNRERKKFIAQGGKYESESLSAYKDNKNMENTRGQ